MWLYFYFYFFEKFHLLIRMPLALGWLVCKGFITCKGFCTSQTPSKSFCKAFIKAVLQLSYNCLQLLQLFTCVLHRIFYVQPDGTLKLSFGILNGFFWKILDHIWSLLLRRRCMLNLEFGLLHFFYSHIANKNVLWGYIY